MYYMSARSKKVPIAFVTCTGDPGAWMLLSEDWNLQFIVSVTLPISQKFQSLLKVKSRVGWALLSTLSFGDLSYCTPYWGLCKVIVRNYCQTVPWGPANRQSSSYFLPFSTPERPGLGSVFCVLEPAMIPTKAVKILKLAHCLCSFRKPRG